jgi:hypothetical protein
MWYHNPALPEFILTASICLLCLWCALSGYFTESRADEAWTLAYRQKCRIDRMNRQANIGSKETKYVNVEEGFEVRDSWVDDFSRTRADLRLPQTRMARLLALFKKKAK